MERKDNYEIQAQLARQYFLRYDQEQLIKKLKLEADEDYLYTKMLCKPYRIRRKTGDLQRLEDGIWMDANTFGEVMVLLDLVCDSREDRFCTGRWKNMTNFGAMFHRNLLEQQEDPFAQAIQKKPDAFRQACEALGGLPESGGDISYALPVFENLKLLARFWEADDDFPPQVCWMWEENALMYLKYETMHFALGMLKNRILDKMQDLTA